MALTKEQRDALPAEDFAVPGKRKLPMHDARHTSLAWDMVDRTEGLTEAERSAARRRVLRKANALGMDTSSWNKIKAMSMDVSLAAMSLAVPTDDHPNRMPFSGCLVWLDEPSDKPPHGAGGRLVVMTEAAAKKAIPTLLGMGVNYTPNLSGHDKQAKIGIITEAEIQSDPTNSARRGVYISGFIYAADFPNAAARIRADKDALGFSFETTDTMSADPGADILEITSCVFTGAAILRKDKAAYSTTSLAAHAEGQPQDDDMTPEELAAALAAALKPTADTLTTITGRLDKIEAAQADPKNLAAANQLHLVEPHAKALESCADGMTAAGIGGHESRGHAVLARKMAAHMRASAAMGELPHIYRDHDFFASANGEKKEGGADTAAITAAVEAAVKPLKDALASNETIIKDLKASAERNAEAPARKTLSPEITALLTKLDIKASADGKLTVAQVDQVLDAQKLEGTERFAAKLRLQAQGLIAA